MWFKRKSKNRRLARSEVLDVKLRSSHVRTGRRRLLAMALGAAFATVFGLYLFWRAGEWALDRLVYHNKAFTLQEIDLRTDGAIAIDQLRRWAGVKPEENLLALDLARVKRDLELAPLVRSASVERILPHTLRIRVDEREPLAQIKVPRPLANDGLDLAVLYLDEEGVVIPPLESRQRALPPGQSGEQLPLISGISPNHAQLGRRIEAPQVQAALQLILSFEQSPMAGLADLRRIDVSAPDVLVVTTGQGGVVTFGLQELDHQLRRWRGIFDAGQKLGKAIATLDLAVTDNIPARWLEASEVSRFGIGTPKSPSPSRFKRKHV